MIKPRLSRREALKLLGSMPLVASAAIAQNSNDAVPAASPGAQAQPGAQPARPPGRVVTHFDGPLTPSPTAIPGGKPLLTLFALSLQWATDWDEAADTAAQAGWPAIAWTVRRRSRGNANVLPENVARDLPKTVAAAKKAGLQVPILMTAIQDDPQYIEPLLDAMSKLGLRLYQITPPLGRYDYTKDLQPQLDVWKPRIDALAKLNEKYGTTASYHTEGSATLMGGGGWDLWLLLRDYDPKYIGMDLSLGHCTMKGGPELWELIRYAHKNTLAIACNDIRWVKKTDPVGGPRRSDPSESWPWTAEYVVPGTGMVNFQDHFAYLKSIGYAGPLIHYSEYFIDVPGASKPANLLQPNIPTEMPKELYISNVRRDCEFYSKTLAGAG